VTSTEQQIEHFVATLESMGGSAGNQRLREALGWQESTYDRIKQQLLDDGRIIPGRGRGGSVALAVTYMWSPIRHFRTRNGPPD
jgi:type I restriction enzyme M protein